VEEILSGRAIGGAQTTEKRRSLEGGPGNFKDVYWRPQDNGSDTMLKVHVPYSPSKDALRKEGITWLIKCLGEGNLSDVGHFNTPPHVWQLMAKHVDNNGRERPIIAINLWL
jgi:hypothetical protein